MSAQPKEREYYRPTLDPERDLRPVGASTTKTNLKLGPNVAVLVIDMSPMFVDEWLFPNADKGVGVACANAIRDFLITVRELELPVIYTTDYVFKTEAEAGAWMYRFPSEQRQRIAKMDKPELHEIVPVLKPHENELVLLKEKPSAFFGTQLQSILNHHRTDTLVITGMSTSGCVRATAVDAFSLNYKCVIPIECVADSRRASHEIALYDMDAMNGDVRPVAEVAAELREMAAGS